jgi:hypothetical protein
MKPCRALGQQLVARLEVSVSPSEQHDDADRECERDVQA